MDQTEPGLVNSLLNATEGPPVHWVFDCPESPLEWWAPLAISAIIYTVATLYLLIRFLVTKFRPEPSPRSTAYPNIFRGIYYNACEDDGEQDIDLMDDDSEKFQYQWMDDYQINELDDWRFPSIATMAEAAFELPSVALGKSEQSGIDEEDGIDEANGVKALKGKEKRRNGGAGEHRNEVFVSLDMNDLKSKNEEPPEQLVVRRRGAIPRARRIVRFTQKSGSWNQHIRIYCEQMTSVSYPTGRIMLVIYVLLCTISWIIYIIGTIFLSNIENQPDVQKELKNHRPLIVEGLCLTRTLAALNWSDVIIHVYFLIYFIFRLGAAVDRCKFFFKLTSLVDVLTICGSFVAVFQPRYHLDLGFLRAFNIFNFGDVLRYLGILSSNNALETVDICFTMFAMWMVASGAIHVIIHLGDFWKSDHFALPWNYLDCCYFLLVTMSTVGYGDYHPVTMLGKFSICVFIPVAMGIFAGFVPEIFRKMSSSREQSNSYQPLEGHQHVVVCGHFNNFSLSAVLRGFFHIEHASRRRLVNMVILCVSPMDLALRAILTKYNAWVRYYQGTPADPQDLARICFRSSKGALVLATPNSTNSSEEDGANIMQAIALKAHSQRIRVLVQLHHVKNKGLLYNFPRWTCRNKDMVICMDELKLGLIALNSLAPGFSTLALNLLNGHRVKNMGKQTQKEKWRREYEYGVSMEIYDVNLSYEFHNLGAQELVLFAYEMWNVLICALYCIGPDKTTVIINPAGYKDLKIDALTTKAIVIATNSTIVNRMRNYCTKCRAHESGETCQCPTRLQFFIQAVGLKKGYFSIFSRIVGQERGISDDESDSQLPDEELMSEPFVEDQPETPQPCKPGDISAPLSRAESFHGVVSHTSVATLRVPPMKVDQASRFTIGPVVAPQSARSGMLVRSGVFRNSMMSNFGDYYPTPHRPFIPKYVDSTGCFHWIPDTPIERVKLTPSEAIRYQFTDHFLLCIVGPLAGDSLNIRSFVLPLRFHWMEVKDIVILGDTSIIDEEEWSRIKNVPHVFLVQGNPCSTNDLSAVRLKHCTAVTILGGSTNNTEEDHCLRDKNTLLCAMTIRSMIEQSPKTIHLTTELLYEQNAHHFSSAESHQIDFKLPLRFQEAFARGIVFSNTLLYSSISSLYFSGAVFQFLRNLLFGKAVDELDSADLLRSGLQRGPRNSTSKALGVRVALMKMGEVPFGALFSRSVKKALRYKDVFTHALMCWRILCLGIYRLDRRGFRVVITNPPKTLKVCIDDQVFCFIPSEFTVHSEDTMSVLSAPSMESSVFFTRTPGATFTGMAASELARQSMAMIRNLPQMSIDKLN